MAMSTMCVCVWGGGVSLQRIKEHQILRRDGEPSTQEDSLPTQNTLQVPSPPYD